MAKAGDQPVLFMFMGMILGMAADFIFHSRSLASTPMFSDPKWDIGDAGQIAAALGCGIMGAISGSQDLSNIGIGALGIQAYMKVLSYKYPALPRYIIARGGVI